MSKAVSNKALFKEIVQKTVRRNTGIADAHIPSTPSFESNPFFNCNKSTGVLSSLLEELPSRSDYKITGDEVSLIYNSFNPYITVRNFISPLSTSKNLKNANILNYLEKFGILSISRIRHPYLFTFDNQYQIVFKNVEYSKSYYRSIKNNLHDGRLMKKEDYNITAASGAENSSLIKEANIIGQYVLNNQESQRVYSIYMNNLLHAFEGENEYRSNLIKSHSKYLEIANNSKSENKMIIEYNSEIMDKVRNIERQSCILRTTLGPQSFNYRKIPSILWQYDIKHVFPLKWIDDNSQPLADFDLGLDINLKEKYSHPKKNIYFIAFNNHLDTERFVRNFHGLKISNKHQLLINSLSPV